MPKNTPRELAPTHWKNRTSTQKDTSKRVAQGCTIDPKQNIITDRTRRRKVPITYNDHELAKRIIDGQIEKMESKSNNILEKRSAMKDITNKKKVTKPEKARRARKANKSSNSNKKVQNEKEDKMEVEEQQPVVEEKEAETKVVSRRNKRRSKSTDAAIEPELSKQAKSAMEKLGASLSDTSMKLIERKYRGTPVPLAIHQFAAMATTIKDKRFENHALYKYLDDIEFGCFSFPDAEWEDMMKYFPNKKMYIVGDGSVVLLANLEDKTSDFEVSIFDDAEEVEESDRVVGPFKISKLLKGAKIDEGSDN